jgi:uncharacterized protein YjbI with pentapeptide repeats
MGFGGVALGTQVVLAGYRGAFSDVLSATESEAHMNSAPVGEGGAVAGVPSRERASRSHRPDRLVEPLSVWFTIAAGVLAVLVMVLLLLYLRRAAGGAPDARMETVKVGLAAGLWVSALFALWLAARRQRSTEVANLQAAHAAIDRRFTELFSLAVEQLGSPDPPVRLAGLYGLERIANGDPAQRQSVVNIICGYLRMPCGGLDDVKLFTDAAVIGADKCASGRVEREVRLTAQRILAAHLRMDSACPWTSNGMEIELDLTRAELVDFKLVGCQLGQASFAGSTFLGETKFSGTNFTRDVTFESASFAGPCHFDRMVCNLSGSFERTTFAKAASFALACFRSDARFARAIFGQGASFDQVRFDGYAFFGGSVFSEERADFAGAHFARSVVFDGAHFNSGVSFAEAHFHGAGRFRSASFAKDAVFADALFTDAVELGTAKFSGLGGPVGLVGARMTSQPRTITSPALPTGFAWNDQDGAGQVWIVAASPDTQVKKPDRAACRNERTMS